MNFLKFAEIVNTFMAKIAVKKYHAIMSLDTLDSILRSRPAWDGTYTALDLSIEKDGKAATIMGVPVYINGQVPYGEAYLMFGFAPKSCMIWSDDEKLLVEFPNG